ncbi:DNA cytosine methyltransferase [Mesomycoplasma lagogenitalium]|uniref:DNA (cytosine-5-)-methyltransferase n=1 Tax=Mesomycoplasma lagogenitalium TaxID=171286 RepID=A0ABY8LWQ7_9BACT|nr:DNA cytosine methyltransferase [Mesomycoplasma lagogenitalium]WGI36856.1 DNA cytosine methyltransferase [Mesomycoplasma lagogenitalium]
MKKYKIASFFAGVGGIDLGFQEIGEIVYANEYNLNSIKTYELNFPLKVDFKDIKEVDENKIPDFDIMLAGFPCQAFSIAGKRQGFEDEKGRGNLFFELERIFKNKKPEIIFLENVKNLFSHDKGNTFKTIIKHLEQENYYVKYQILNTMEYGNIPQNRERIYIVAFKNKNHYDNFTFPKKEQLKITINDIVDINERVNPKYFYTETNFKYYENLKSQIVKFNTVYQWRRQYVRENKSSVCPTLTANMGTGGHNVPLILTNYGIRKLTPKECFLFQGFDKNYKLANIADSHLYKQAGNSVSVSVIKKIASEIEKVIKMHS